MLFFAFFFLFSCIFVTVPKGASDSVRKYFMQSQEAEARANASTIDDGSPVENSINVRQLTEDKMNKTREDFLRRHTERAQKLDELAGELQTLDLSEISHQVGSDPETITTLPVVVQLLLGENKNKKKSLND